jgi:ankyrin repeat protein
MPKRPLPTNPSLEHLRKQAKRLLAEARAGDGEAVALVREYHPHAAEPPRWAELGFPSLHDAQLALARSYGFASWPKLKHHVERAEPLSWDPAAARAEPASPVERLIRLVCLDYGGWRPGDLVEAEELLAREPELATATIHAAAAVGDARAVRAMLAHAPELVSAPGGPYRWPPLLYACYSRLAPAGERSTLEVARILLAAGADPDAGFLWCGNLPPFTALTGAFGEGEDGNNQPPHPERDALARLLLEAGADPNDGQTLYNRHFRADDGHLELLFEFGLGRDHGGPWFARFADRMGTPARMLVEELWAAAHKNLMPRVKLLVEHGADVNTPGVRDGRTPYEAALLYGNHEIGAFLAAHGARTVPLEPKGAFAAACIGGRRAEALELLARNPELRSALGRHGEMELVRRAVEAKRPEGVRLMAELGFALDAPIGRTPMHEAAWAGDLDLVRLLVELGASTNVRDTEHHSTPLGWARHNRQMHVVAFLMARASLFDAVANDGVERAAELLRGEPALAKAVDEDGDGVPFCLHRGLERLDELVRLLADHGADFGARDHRGQTLVEALAARGDAAVSESLRRRGVVKESAETRRPLAFDATLAEYEQEAESLLRSLAAGDREAASRFKWEHPRYRDEPLSAVEPAALARSDAELVVAREHGFEDWSALAAFARDVQRDGPARRYETAVEAMLAGDVERLRSMLRAHPELVRARSSRRHHATLLHYVAANGTERQRTPPTAVEIAKTLLEAGAEVDALADMYEQRCTTMGLLVSSSPPAQAGLQIPLAEMLLDHGAALEGPESKWQSALMTALAFGFVDTARALVRRGAAVEFLPAAAGLGSLADARRLLPEADARSRHAALALAAQHGHADVVRLLLDAGEDPSRYNPDGFHAHSTPLHQAVWSEHMDVVRLLVERGARLDLRDTVYEGTPLDWAVYGKKHAIAEYLRGRGAG